jgi:3-phenylpropionate/cinnamic acid dioxygenase small subunit
MPNDSTLTATERLAAQDVIVRYANTIDERDFETFRTCFTPDVVMTGFTPEPVRGIEDWVAFVEKQLAPFTWTQHLLGPPSFASEGQADRVRMRTDLQASHFFRDPEGRIFTLWGVYRTVLVRDGEWRMAEHHLDIRSTRFDAPPSRG